MTIEIKASTQTQSIIALAGIKRQELEQVSIQIASGDKHTDFQGLAGESNVEKFVSLQSSLTKSTSYLHSNNLIIARIDAMSQAVEQMQSIASSVSQLIAQRRNSASGADIPLDVQGSAILDDIAGKLNIKFDGRYLFSGTKSNIQTVPNIHASILSDDGEPTASYYRGDSEEAAIKISDSQKLSYGITGNDVAFQELIGAVQLAMEGHLENDDTKLASAMDLITSAVTNLASVRASLGSSKNTISQANTAHTATNLLVGQNLKDVSQTDIVEATTRMSELQATVQATYIAFQRLNELRLSSYLN